MTSAPPRTFAAIAAGSSTTAAAGALIAREGGSAVDIAVACALAATLAESLMCSIGGSGFVMIRRAGREPELIDGGDAMPNFGRHAAGARPKWREVHLPYGDGIDVMAGHASIAVPGFLAAMELAWKRHGRLPWSVIVAPALELARNGFKTHSTTATWLSIAGHLLFCDQPASRDCFFPGGRAPVRGELLKVPGMDHTLEMISAQGSAALYGGELGEAVAQEITEHGGSVTRNDLAAYRALVRAPLRRQSQGFELALNPPPAVGGTGVAALLALIESGWSQSLTPPEKVVLHALAQRCLLHLREDAWPKRLTDDIARRLLSEASLRGHRRALGSPHTAHCSVATADGDVVAITMSNGYGSGITIPGTGIACNNSLGEPELNPEGFLVGEPGSRLVSNMAPTVAWHPDGRCLAFGTPGASRITTALVQVWVRHAMEGDSFEDAVTAPRLHVEHRADGLRVQCEPGIDTRGLGEDFTVRTFSDRNMFFGGVQLAGRDQDGSLHAVADDRRHGEKEFVR